MQVRDRPYILGDSLTWPSGKIVKENNNHLYNKVECKLGLQWSKAGLALYFDKIGRKEVFVDDSTQD